MDDLHRTADKVLREADHLAQVVQKIDPNDPDPHAVNLALAGAKRGRRELTLLTRALARLRDTLQP